MNHNPCHRGKKMNQMGKLYKPESRRLPHWRDKHLWEVDNLSLLPEFVMLFECFRVLNFVFLTLCPHHLLRTRYHKISDYNSLLIVMTKCLTETVREEKFVLSHGPSIHHGREGMVAFHEAVTGCSQWLTRRQRTRPKSGLGSNLQRLLLIMLLPARPHLSEVPQSSSPQTPTTGGIINWRRSIQNTGTAMGAS